MTAVTTTRLLPTPSLRVAAAQAESVPGALSHNASTGAGLVDRAASRGARLVVLPELFLPGYHPPTLADPSPTDVACAPDGSVDDARLDPLRRSASDAGAVVLVGAAVRATDGLRYLSTLVVDPDGTVREAYRKQYLCGTEERSLFRPGEAGRSVCVDGWVLGLGICYDGCFPEHARAAALAGAQVYVCPSAYLVGAAHRREIYYRARAVENGMFVVLADAVGGPSPWRFGGGSAIFDPEGRPLAQAAEGQADVVVADLELSLLTLTRATHTMLADAREKVASGA